MRVAGEQLKRCAASRPHGLELAGQRAQVEAVECGDIDQHEVDRGDQRTFGVGGVGNSEANAKSLLLQSGQPGRQHVPVVLLGIRFEDEYRVVPRQAVNGLVGQRLDREADQGQPGTEQRSGAVQFEPGQERHIVGARGDAAASGHPRLQARHQRKLVAGDLFRAVQYRVAAHEGMTRSVGIRAHRLGLGLSEAIQNPRHVRLRVVSD